MERSFYGIGDQLLKQWPRHAKTLLTSHDYLLVAGIVTRSIDMNLINGSMIINDNR